MCSSQPTTYLKFTALNSDRVLDWQRSDALALRMAAERIALEHHNTQVQLRTQHPTTK